MGEKEADVKHDNHNPRHKIDLRTAQMDQFSGYHQHHRHRNNKIKTKRWSFLSLTFCILKYLVNTEDIWEIISTENMKILR